MNEGNIFRFKILFSFDKFVILIALSGGSEFLSYKIELRNRVTQNDVTLQVTNSKDFIEIPLSSY